MTVVVLGDQRSRPSDVTGTSSVGFIGGCEDALEVEAFAEPPVGFLPTTPQPVPVSLPRDPRVTPNVEFGFQPTP